MNDLEKMKQMFTDLSIGFTVYKNDGFDISDKYEGFVIKIDRGCGHGGFYAIFHFDNDGSFTQYGCFE
jgi:hypothetical protein